MKTAIYIEDGLMQLVLTPENEIDKKVLNELENPKKFETYRGQFYPCQGGWTRWQDFGQSELDRSLILKVVR